MSTEPKLVAVTGPFRGQTFEFRGSEFSIGRVDDLTLTIDDTSVSKRHCIVVREGSSFRVRDLGSLNGTLLNGERTQESALQHGDRIGVGGSSFVFLTRAEDVAALLSEVQVCDDGIDLTHTTELGREDTVYLNPTGAQPDTRVARGYSVLLQFGTAIRSSGGLAALEEQSLDLIMQAIPAETGAILFTGSQPDQFVSTFGKRADGTLNVAVSRTVVRRVLQEKRGLLNNDVLRTMPDVPSLALSDVGSLLAVPLLSNDRAIGAICLTRSKAAPGFEEADLHLLTAMAAMLELPLDSARHLDWLEGENRRLQTDIDGDHRLIGDSAAMRQVYKFIRKVAPTDSTVLVRGESGTGKELVARALHRASPRANAPFVVINCAALQRDLLESDLFGHEKGSFTGAITQKKGKFEIADGGTVFLDEIAELAPDLQVKLLRVLQEREFERVGGTRPIRVDVRAIAATDRDLEEAMRQGRFRHELYYRLNVVSVEIPALRQHPEDILPLANHFAARFVERHNSRVRGISAEAEACLTQYDWPGNVRELQNAVERAVVLGESDVILPEDLPESIVEAHPPATTSRLPFHDGVRDAKRRLIQSALDQAGGNHAEAARLLGLNRTYLHRLIRNLDLIGPGVA